MSKRLIQAISVRGQIPRFVDSCRVSLEAYAEKVNADLRVVDTIPDDLDYELPSHHPKFLLYDNIRHFVESTDTGEK